MGTLIGDSGKSALLGSALTLVGTLAGSAVHAGDSTIAYWERQQDNRTAHVREFKQSITEMAPSLVSKASASDVEVSLVKLIAIVDEVSDDDSNLSTSEYKEIVSIASAIGNSDVQVWLGKFYGGNSELGSVLKSNPGASTAIANAIDEKDLDKEANVDGVANLPSYLKDALASALTPAQTGWIYLGQGTSSKNGAVCALNYSHTIEAPSTGTPSCFKVREDRVVVGVPRSGDVVTLAQPVNVRSNRPELRRSLPSIIGIFKAADSVRVIESPVPLVVNTFRSAVWAHVQLLSQ